MNAKRNTFDDVAHHFVSSSIHQFGRGLTKIIEAAGSVAGAVVCDLGCGAGHLGRQFCGKAKRVIFVDPSKKMLETIIENPPSTGDWEMKLAPAEQLPLESESIDIVVSRLAAHHFSDLAQAWSEIYRVLKPGGRFVLVDLIGPGPEIDKNLFSVRHQIEVLHDPSHQHDWHAQLILETFRKAGFKIREFQPWIIENEFPLPISEWCQMTNVPQGLRSKIESLLKTLSFDQRRSLGWNFQNGFEIRVPVFLALGEKDYADR